MDNILEGLDKRDRRGMEMINFKLKIAEKLEGIVNIDKKFREEVVKLQILMTNRKNILIIWY